MIGHVVTNASRAVGPVLFEDLSEIRIAKETIRRAGCRATSGRIAVYLALKQALRPLSHSEVLEQTRPLGLGRATVYRNLITLTDAGLAARRNLGDQVFRFELDPEDVHPHFVCVKCGLVRCLRGLQLTLNPPAPGLDPLPNPALEVLLRGLCSECSKPAGVLFDDPRGLRMAQPPVLDTAYSRRPA